MKLLKKKFWQNKKVAYRTSNSRIKTKLKTCSVLLPERFSISLAPSAPHLRDSPEFLHLRFVASFNGNLFTFRRYYSTINIKMQRFYSPFWQNIYFFIYHLSQEVKIFLVNFHHTVSIYFSAMLCKTHKPTRLFNIKQEFCLNTIDFFAFYFIIKVIDILPPIINH